MADSSHLLKKENKKFAKSILAPIINPVYGNAVTYSVYVAVLWSWFKDGDFLPVKD